jgi:hypothetical protein
MRYAMTEQNLYQLMNTLRGLLKAGQNVEMRDERAED